MEMELYNIRDSKAKVSSVSPSLEGIDLFTVTVANSHYKNHYKTKADSETVFTDKVPVQFMLCRPNVLELRFSSARNEIVSENLTSEDFYK